MGTLNDINNTNRMVNGLLGKEVPQPIDEQIVKKIIDTIKIKNNGSEYNVDVTVKLEKDYNLDDAWVVKDIKIHDIKDDDHKSVQITPDLKDAVECKIEQMNIDESDCLSEATLDFNRLYNFKRGIARFKKGKKHGLINKKGKVVAEAEYDRIYNFKNRRAKVRKDGKYGALDMEGKLIIPIEYSIEEVEDKLSKMRNKKKRKSPHLKQYRFKAGQMVDELKYEEELDEKYIKEMFNPKTIDKLESVIKLKEEGFSYALGALEAMLEQLVDEDKLNKYLDDVEAWKAKQEPSMVESEEDYEEKSNVVDDYADNPMDVVEENDETIQNPAKRQD